MSQRIPDFPATQILVSRLLVYLGREVTGQLDQRLRPYNLNEIEFRALMMLYSTANSTANPGELCIGLNQSSANVTRITDVLVARGLITRVPDGEDRRRLVLQITPHGITVLNHILPVLLTVMRTTYRDFPVEELNQVVVSLKGLAAALDRMSKPATNGGI